MDKGKNTDQLTIRISTRLREDSERCAINAGISHAEWIRRALQAQVERDTNNNQLSVTIDQVREIIREELRNYERVDEER